MFKQFKRAYVMGLLSLVTLLTTGQSCTCNMPLGEDLHGSGLGIQNDTWQNLIVFVNDDLADIAHARRYSSVMRGNFDMQVRVEDLQGNVVIDQRVTKEQIAASKDQSAVITIPEDAEPITPYTVAGNSTLKIHNPFNQDVFVVVNDVPFVVISAHHGTCDFNVFLHDIFQPNVYHVVAMNAKREILCSQDWTSTELSESNWEVDLPPTPDSGFPLIINNKFRQYYVVRTYNIYVNSQLIGVVKPGVNQLTISPDIKPIIRWGCFIRDTGIDTYNIEIRDDINQVLYIHNWYYDSLERSDWTIDLIDTKP
jgi:hypothetical protein